MAKAKFEVRQFTDRNSGEIKKYDWYGIIGIVNGERMELPLKELNAAEKIAFKMVAMGDDPVDDEYLQVSTRKAEKGEAPSIERKQKTILDDDDEDMDNFLS